jgi:hypothetical protein
VSLLETLQTRNEDSGIHIAAGLVVIPTADSLLEDLQYAEARYSGSGLRSNAEREFMQLNETHERIREQFLAPPPEQATTCGADEEIKLKTAE